MLAGAAAHDNGSHARNVSLIKLRDPLSIPLNGDLMVMRKNSASRGGNAKAKTLRKSILTVFFSLQQSSRWRGRSKITLCPVWMAPFLQVLSGDMVLSEAVLCSAC